MLSYSLFNEIISEWFLMDTILYFFYYYFFYFIFFTASAVYREASASFLFSLVNHSGLPPTRMALKAGREGQAIFCFNGNGPVFGGNDLRFPSTPNSNSCSVNLNNSYECPVGQNATTIFTGAQSFTIQEMEVFGFEK